MSSHTTFGSDNTDSLNNPKKKHPFTIEKAINQLNKERKNKTIINPSYENLFIKHFKKEVPYAKNIHV